MVTFLQDSQKQDNTFLQLKSEDADCPSDDSVDIIFLHASPNVFKDFDTNRKYGFQVPPALNFKKEE